MKKIAVVHGRFQPLHNGHLDDYILKAWDKSKCDYMYIGITNPDPFHTKSSDSDPERSLPQSNPLTFIERLEMIKNAVLEKGISLQQFDIVPFPINFPELLAKFAPENAIYYLTVFDDWGEEKVEILRSVYGRQNVDVLYRKSIEEKKITSTMIRQRIRDERPWEHMVPDAITKYLKDNNILQRIKETQKI